MTLQQLLENNEYQTFEYSGRGMMGKKCLAVTMDRSSLRILWLIASLTAVCDTLDPTHWRLASNVKIDGMGTDHVIYWPMIVYTEGANYTHVE